MLGTKNTTVEKKVANKVEEAVGTARSTYEDTRDQITDRTQELSSNLRNTFNNTQGRVQEFANKADTTVTEYHWTAIALTLLVGIIVGFFLRSGK